MRCSALRPWSFSSAARLITTHTVGSEWGARPYVCPWPFSSAARFIITHTALVPIAVFKSSPSSGWLCLELRCLNHYQTCHRNDTSGLHNFFAWSCRGFTYICPLLQIHLPVLTISLIHMFMDVSSQPVAELTYTISIGQKTIIAWGSTPIRLFFFALVLPYLSPISSGCYTASSLFCEAWRWGGLCSTQSLNWILSSTWPSKKGFGVNWVWQSVCRILQAIRVCLHIYRNAILNPLPTPTTLGPHGRQPSSQSL